MAYGDIGMENPANLSDEELQEILERSHGSQGRKVHIQEEQKARLSERIAELEATCEKQSEQISEQGAEIERLRKCLWAIVWDNKGFTQEDIEWAGQCELDLADTRISEQGKRIAELEAELQIAEAVSVRYQIDAVGYKTERDKLREACEAIVDRLSSGNLDDTISYKTTQLIEKLEAALGKGGGG